MAENKTLADNTVVVILAAGKGTRMGNADMAKVCFEIDSVPAINRTIATFKARRFNKFLLIVGSNAQDVLDTVTREHPGVMYAYQSPQLGTGHAARIAAAALENVGYEGNVLVTMGDKFIEADAIESLAGGFVKQHADLALLSIPKTKATEGSGGRVFLDKTGQAIEIIEKPDLARQAIADQIKVKLAKASQLSGSEIVKIIDRHIPTKRKQTAAVGELLELASTKNKITKATLEGILQKPQYNLKIRGEKYSAAAIEKACKHVNPSLYLFKPGAFYQGVAMIDNDNAQGEFYLTDIVRHLDSVKDTQGESKFRIRTVSITNPDWIQGFNSPDELLAIQDYLRQKNIVRQKQVKVSTRPRLQKKQYCGVGEWIDKIENDKPAARRWLGNIYGPHPQLHQHKRKDLLKVLRCYGKKFSFDDKVCIVRAPGRINLMGRHIDHRGGFNNFLAINRETIAVAGLRNDDNVVAYNTEPGKFNAVKFNVSELIGQFAWTDWINFVNSDWVRNMLHSSAGHWGNYIKAAMLRLQHQYQDVKVKGLNLAVTGDVPIAAGLSSSSTIVVATLQAAIALNNFELTSQQFIDLCGQGEWFVGSRGGAGDHAAIYLGQRGKIAQVGYLPFRVENTVEAPANYQVIIANSHVKAPKSGSAKDRFNSRIASYNLGLALLKQRCPQLSPALEYVRDIDPQKLGCSISDIYRMLLKVPQFMTRQDIKKMLSAEHAELIRANFATHAKPKQYNIRGVLLFGAAEIARSKMCMDYLQAGRLEQFGTLMKVSHDGDRVSRPTASGDYATLAENCSDEYLNRLITNLGSEAPEAVLNAQLYMQPGGYACSTPQIDKMVDIACGVDGVVGAQITGAGLGGCIMILATKESVPAIQKALTKHYYKPNNLKPAIIPCTTTEGAGLAEF
ncbi:MAG TPA: hypothetical protein ENL03_00830 [Phycisphaerae bacterium]|nr:hypothetical protein [Phycisphaerae bacterium]